MDLENKEEMTVEELEEIKKNFSKAKDSPAYQKTPGEMYKKIVLRRTLKNVAKSFKNSAQTIAYATCSDFEFNNKTGVSNNSEEIRNPFANALPVNNQQALTTNVQNTTAKMPQNEFLQPEATVITSETENSIQGHSDVSEYEKEETIETIYECTNCGSIINQAEDSYSRRNYGKPLCRNCQALAKNGEL